MAKRKLTEQQHIENKARLAQVILDEKVPIKVGSKTYHIGALTYYAKWRISSLITSIELSDASISTLIQAMAKNLPVMAEILAISILVKRERIDREHPSYNGELDALIYELMDEPASRDWGSLLAEVFQRLDTGFFFGLTEMVRGLNSMNDKAGYRREIEKMKTSKEDGYIPIQSLVK